MKLASLTSKVKPMTPKQLAPLPQAAETTERLRGRAGQDRRARWLRLHPLCWACKRENRTTVGDVVDHHEPIWAGGADNESNFATLCQKPHHDAKTACEAGMRSHGGFDLSLCTCGLHALKPGGSRAFESFELDTDRKSVV